MRTPYQPRTRRNILCVFPRYANSFGTFQHAYPFFGRRVKAFMPPQGLLVIAAYLPESWPVRFVDENARAVTDDELEWADAVFVSGMHIQRPQIHDVIARAQRRGRRVVLGGPSVSGCPEYYPEADVRHLGELGDATDQLIEWLDTTAGRPDQPPTFATATACRWPPSRPPRLTWRRSGSTFWPVCSFRVAARTCASSATSPPSMVVTPG